MAMTITIELSDLDEKCMKYFAADPEEFVRNFIAARIFVSKQEIYQEEIRRMTADPNISTIPADVDTVVEQANIRYASEQPALPSMTPPI
jgi:hypothetical protein